MELVLQRVGLAHHLEHTDASGHEARSHRVGEEVRTAALTQHVNDFLATRGEATHGTTKGLAEGTGQDFNLATEVEVLGHATTGLADHASGVAFVHHHHGVVFLGKFVNLVERANVAVHREHAVGDDEAEAAALRVLQLLLKVGHVGVGIAETLGLAEAHAVDDGSVVQSIGDDGVVGTEQRFKHTAVGIEASSVKDGVFRAEELSNLGFQLLVEVLATTDEADRSHTIATGIHAVLGGLNQFGVVGEAEIIVCTEVEAHLAANHDFSALCALDDAFTFIKAIGFNLSQFLLQILLKICVHFI